MMKPKSLSIPSGQPTPITIHEDDSLPKQKAIRDAKSNKIRRCVSVPTTLFDVESILKTKTVDESLHSTYGSDNGSRSGEQKLQFKSVVIREYARTVGDNPSCSSGPPVSISWEYNIAGELSLDDYENTRPARRSHFEMVLPRKVRHDMLRKEWDVRQKDIAEAVRRNIRVKNQRKATVNNLSKTKLEEKMESLRRKMSWGSVSAEYKRLDLQMDEAIRQRNKLRLDVQMAQEYDEDVASTEDNSSS